MTTVPADWASSGRPLTAAEVIHPGRWRHFKGGEYRVLSLARHSETGEDYVVYQGALRRAGVLGASGLHVAGNCLPGRQDPAPVCLGRREVDRLRPRNFAVYWPC